MEEIRVSVIIPVYNVEAYLPDCLASVTGQTLREIEILCVDDCSTDRCREIRASDRFIIKTGTAIKVIPVLTF